MRRIAAEHIIATGNKDKRWTDVYLHLEEEVKTAVEALQRERDVLQVQLRLSRFNQANAEAEYNGLQAQIRALTQQRDAERDRLREALERIEMWGKCACVKEAKAALTPAGGGNNG